MSFFQKKRQIPVQGKTIFAAHRGWSDKAPENTVPAFRAAAKAGFGAVECDVWEIGDEQPELAVFHDENLKRMCGANVEIGSLSPREIKEYRVRNGANIKEFGELEIPFFEDYMEIIAAADIIPIVELKAGKTCFSRKGLEKLTTRLYEKRRTGKAVVQSFHMQTLLDIRPLLKQETDLFLLTKKQQDLQKEKLREYRSQGITGISMKHTLISHLEEIKAYGLKTAVWTVDSSSQALRLYQSGTVDYIISNKKLFI